jgi:chemotaxis receptor (MCP) glutamine deamidase CheD
MNNIQMYGMISHSINFKANKFEPVKNTAKKLIRSCTKPVMLPTLVSVPLPILVTMQNGRDTNTESSNYPKWITDIYNQVDKKKDGIITQDEIDNLDRAKEGIGTIYIFEDGMSIDDFVNRNRSVFSGYVHFEGDPIEGRQIIDPNGKLQRTNFTRKISFDSEKSIEVMLGEYSIIEYSENTPFMQTYGIGPCVAVTIYDKKSKKGFLAHIDTHSKAKSLNGILSRLKTRGFDTDNCEARIIGGQTGYSTETVKEIQKQLNSKKINIVEMDVLGSDARSIQLDLNTGEVTDYNETIHTRNDMDIVVVRTLYSENLIEYRPKI